MIEEIAQELHRKGMPLEEARVRAAGATWDDKGFRLGPGPGEKGAATPPPRDPSGAGGLYVPGAPAAAAAGAGGAGPAPAGAGGAAPAAAPVAGAAARGTFQPHEALAIAARGDPAVFAAMLRQYSPAAGGEGDWAITHDDQGNWVRYNKKTGDFQPIPMGGARAQGDTILAPNDPRRAQAGIPPGDNRTWKIGPKGEKSVVADPADPSFDQIEKLQDNLNANPEYKKFAGAHQALGGLKAAFTQADAQGDALAIYQLSKALDPNSTVGPSDQLIFSSTGGVPDYMQKLLKDAFGQASGGSMRPETRRALYNAAAATVSGMEPGAKRAMDQQRNRALSRKLDPDQVGKWDFEKLTPAGPDEFKERPGASSSATKTKKEPKVVYSEEDAARVNGPWRLVDRATGKVIAEGSNDD
jgi:hypothetical protein